jgi:hypothetical protein
MTVYIVKTRCFLFPDAATALNPPAPAGTPILKVADRFDGAFNATSNLLIDKTAPAPAGVVEQECLIEVPAVLPPITTEVGRTNFCWAATDSASEATADRNYLLSVAYYLSQKLSNFGKPADLRYGPFRYNAEEWFAAVAKANQSLAPEDQFKPEDLFDPVVQMQMAAIRAGKAMKDFKAAHNRFPIPVELYFYERLGEEALTLLKLAPGQTCAAAFAAAPAAGTYGAEIKDRPSGEVIKEVKDGLTAGFVASRPDVERLQPHRRFFSDEDIAPWLTVARLMTSDDLSVVPTALAGTFMTFPPALGANDRRSAAFAAFCLIECGVTEAKEKRPDDNKAGLPDTWKTWSNEAVAPLRPGTIVVTEPQADGKASVGILAETPTDDNYKVYFCSDKDKISVGVTTIAKAKIVAQRWLDITGAGDPSDPTLGSLSKKYESGSLGPGAISPGRDAGGVSYGTYQFSTANGSVAAFVASLPAALNAGFAGREPGTPEFGAAWTAIANQDPVGFGTLQHDFIKAKYYDKLAAAVKAGAAGFDVNTRSSALQNCFWSTAVQHGVGGATPIVRDVINALKAAGAPPLTPIKPFDKEALEKIYAERGAGPVGAMKHFSNNPADIQAGVANRFKSELADALKMLG